MFCVNFMQETWLTWVKSMEHFQNKLVVKTRKKEQEKTNQTKYNCQSLIQSSLIAIADLMLQWANYFCADPFYRNKCSLETAVATNLWTFTIPVTTYVWRIRRIDSPSRNKKEENVPGSFNDVTNHVEAVQQLYKNDIIWQQWSPQCFKTFWKPVQSRTKVIFPKFSTTSFLH